MRKESKQFFIVSLAVTVIAMVISWFLFSYVFETYDFPGRIISIVFIGSVTYFSHVWLMKTVTDRPKAFGRVFMIQTAGKLFLYMACILGYLVFCKQYAIPFTFQFLIVYLIFAIFEVTSILKFVKSNTGQTPGNTKITN